MQVTQHAAGGLLGSYLLSLFYSTTPLIRKSSRNHRLRMQVRVVQGLGALCTGLYLLADYGLASAPWQVGATVLVGLALAYPLRRQYLRLLAPHGYWARLTAPVGLKAQYRRQPTSHGISETRVLVHS